MGGGGGGVGGRKGEGGSTNETLLIVQTGACCDLILSLLLRSTTGICLKPDVHFCGQGMTKLHLNSLQKHVSLLKGNLGFLENSTHCLESYDFMI